MGVMGTFCQVCGVAAQHDHYVPQPGGMLGIYRGGPGPSRFSPLVAFGAEHAWLERAAALAIDESQSPPVVFGRCSDGGLEGPDGGPLTDDFVGDGLDDRAVLHEACWRLAGEPTCWDILAVVLRPHGLERYQEQLFEFAALVDDGEGWKLVDPDLDTPDGRRNRARILGLLGRAERRPDR